MPVVQSQLMLYEQEDVADALSTRTWSDAKNNYYNPESKNRDW